MSTLIVLKIRNLLVPKRAKCKHIATTIKILNHGLLLDSYISVLILNLEF